MMLRKIFLLLVVCGLLRPGLAAAKPNVVILLADDSGWGDYSASGNPNLKTPQIDSLARDGASLDHFYVCSVCAPTRAELLTGRYHPRTGVRGVSAGQERLNVDELTLADAFKAAGYATGAFGKWHNGSQWPFHPMARGFDEYYGFTSGHWGEYFDPPLEHNGKAVRGRGFIADDLTGHALEFIERNQARPFFCYVPFNTPHSPWAVPDEYWQRTKDRPVGRRGADGEQENLPQTRCALAMMENLDTNVGRVLRKLEELNLSDNTIVIYFSDNGPNSNRWNGGIKGRKGSTDEGGLRSVCFIRWPGQIRAGLAVSVITGAIDLLPTLSGLAAVPRVGEKPLDGRDLSPLLRGTAAGGPERWIFSHQNGKVSVRTPQFRLDDRGALFDLSADPAQRTDLAGQDPEVNTAGEYEVMIPYTCPLADAGSTVELSFKGAMLTGVVKPGWDPPLYTNQDTIPRPAAESRMKEFRPWSPGTIHLEKGRGQLTLRALKMPGQSVMDVRGVYLTLKK